MHAASNTTTATGLRRLVASRLLSHMPLSEQLPIVCQPHDRHTRLGSQSKRGCAPPADWSRGHLDKEELEDLKEALTGEAGGEEGGGGR